MTGVAIRKRTTAWMNVNGHKYTTSFNEAFLYPSVVLRHLVWGLRMG